MTPYKVWDPFIRVFHWSLVGGFTLNAFFNDPEKTPHHYIGYAIVALVALRLVWGLIGPQFARFSQFWPTAPRVVSQLVDMATGRRRVHLGHTPLGALMIVNLLAAMLAIGATGYMMTTNTFWGVGWVEDLHEGLVTWAEISIIAHVAAVLWESRRTGVNLPRAMVTGVKSVPDGVKIEP